MKCRINLSKVLELFGTGMFRILLRPITIRRSEHGSDVAYHLASFALKRIFYYGVQARHVRLKTLWRSRNVHDTALDIREVLVILLPKALLEHFRNLIGPKS